MRFMGHKCCRCLVWKFVQRTTATKECYGGASFDVISMLAASWNAVSWGTDSSFYQKARFCETSDLAVNLVMYVHRKMFRRI
jgi:hypothetical protein